MRVFRFVLQDSIFSPIKDFLKVLLQKWLFLIPSFSGWTLEQFKGNSPSPFCRKILILKSHFPLANKLNADCAAGSIHLNTRILPNSDIAPPLNPDPEITTSIGTGTTTIILSSPIPSNRAKIRSSHVGATGSQSILYPSDWQGVISCQVQVGSCNMWGKGLEIIEARNNNTGLNVYMKGVKGKRKFDGADTSIELRGGPVEIGIVDGTSLGEKGVGGWEFWSHGSMGLLWRGFIWGLGMLIWVLLAFIAWGYLFD